MNLVAITIIVVFFFIGCIYIIYSDRKNECYKLKYNTSKTKIVNAIVWWAYSNIQYEGKIFKTPHLNIKISYYKHKKWAGLYYSRSNSILVYVNNLHTPIQLVNTTIHEVIHAFQAKIDPKGFDNKYYKLLKENSYENHPMEIEARKYAEDYMIACSKYLLEIGYFKY